MLFGVWCIDAICKVQNFIFQRGGVVPGECAKLWNDSSAQLWLKILFGWALPIVQGVFLTGTPPKSSKYKKVNLG